MNPLPMPTPAEDVPSRSFAPRRSLPNGRAVMGALLVTFAAAGAFVVASSGDGVPGAEYLVVVDHVDAGEAVNLDDVALAVMHLPPATASNALTSTRGLEGATALVDLPAGSVLDIRDLRGAAFVDGVAVGAVHELTIPVPTERSPAALVRGDRVTILAHAGPETGLHTAVEDALVLGFDPGGSGIGASGQARLTLALPAATDVTALTVWSYEALTVVLTTRAIDDRYPDRAPLPAAAAPASATGVS